MSWFIHTAMIPMKNIYRLALALITLFFMTSTQSLGEGSPNHLRFIANTGCILKIATNLQADFVFLIDGTDSMEGEINAVKNGLSALVDKLNEAGVDSRFAVVVYGGDPELVLDFTTSLEMTKSAFGKISVWGAVDGFQNNHDVNPEAALEAIRAVLGKGSKVLAQNNVGGDGVLNFRPDARKNLILLTDEDSDQPFHPDNRQGGQNDMEPPDDISETGWQLEIDETAQAMVANQAFINILLKPSDRPSIPQFGDPQCDVSDADLLNFDPQATLAALERKEAGRSLEAQVLRAGLIGRTFDIDSIDDPGFIAKFFAAKVEEVRREIVKKEGSIQVLFEKGSEKETIKNAEVILDASNSMWGQIKGEAKIAIAKTVLEQIIRGLPAEMNVGLRFYGHRYPLDDKRACRDTELAVPISPIVKANLIDIINKIQPKGKTPLVYSVLQAGNDFRGIEKGSIILITDGIESCDGDINAIAPTLKELGIELRLYIVGFDIKEATARDELEAIAKSTEGTYLDAKDSEGLISALKQTLRIEFKILDEKGQLIAQGFVGGEEIKIVDGFYTLRLLVEPVAFETKIIVKPGQKSTFIFEKKEEKWTIKENR
jgi:Mg-chelatase subunit ChlD